VELYGAQILREREDDREFVIGIESRRQIMTRLRGIVKAVVTIAGVVSLSSPLLVSAAGDPTHKGSKDRPSKDGHERGLSGMDSPAPFISRSERQEPGSTSMGEDK
jgi:hypothetical protein